MMESFLAALRFLTIFPLPQPKREDLEKLGKSTSFFPLVGIFLGLVLIGLNTGFSLVLPRKVTSALLVMALAVLSRGLHLDGLADTADALGGGKNKEEVLEIMSQNNIGTFGMVALIFLLLLKFLALDSLFGKLRMLALVLMPVFGRWSVVYAALIHPAAKEEGLGKIFAEETKLPQFLLASSIVVILTVGMLKFQAISFFLGVLIFTAGLTFLLTRKIGGITGDTLGAVIELSEVWFLLLTLILLQGWFWR